MFVRRAHGGTDPCHLEAHLDRRGRRSERAWKEHIYLSELTTVCPRSTNAGIFGFLGLTQMSSVGSLYFNTQQA